MNRPLIIAGAPRSGTNALRDALCRLPEFHTWPCDELNPLWRTGNRDYPTDELTAAHARPEVVSRIHRAFDRQSSKQRTATLVEKTCANTLRLEFVHSVFPNALFVEIVRDGRDAASSAVKRWGAPFELMYTLRKVRYVPKADLAGVVTGQLAHRVLRMGAPRQAKVRTWGPRWTAIDELVTSGASLEEISATQWSACTSASADFFATHRDADVVHVRYEDFVTSPAATLHTICSAAGVQTGDGAVTGAIDSIHARSVGRWRDTPLASDTKAMGALNEELTRLGYATAGSEHG